MADTIASDEQLTKYNQEAFQQLAVAQVPVRVVRTHDGNAIRNPSGFALMIENADSAGMRQIDGHSNGMIFFTSSSPELLIQEVQQELQKLTNAATDKTK